MGVVLILQCQRSLWISLTLLILFVNGPIQEHRHRLDSFGFIVQFFFNLQIYDAVFSDHMLVLFDVTLTCTTVNLMLHLSSIVFLTPLQLVSFQMFVIRTVLSLSLVKWRDSCCLTCGAVERRAGGKRINWRCLQILKDCLCHYQRTVKDAKRKYFSDLIVKSSQSCFI